MGAFDKIVAAVSPRRACEREAWRQQLEILRGYDAAGYGRCLLYTSQRSLLRDITALEDQSQINPWRKSVVKMTLAALNEKRERMIKNGAEK